MIKTGAWAYLDSLVSLRKSLELKRDPMGGFSATINGFNIGVGDTCKGAFVAAIKESKRRRKMDAR